MKPEIGFGKAIATENIGKLSIVEFGMKSPTGVPGKRLLEFANTAKPFDLPTSAVVESKRE